MRNSLLTIGITAGDPAGIGPEIALKAMQQIPAEEARTVLLCRRDVVERRYRQLAGGLAVAGGEEELRRAGAGRILYHVPSEHPVPEPGRGSAETGGESIGYVDTALELWRRGAIDALVTGPVSKGLVQRHGVPFTGHTEYIAGFTGGSPYMMMYSGEYRVVLASTHLPVASVQDYLSQERLLEVIRAGYESIRAIDGGEATLAIAGLDPHCGDDGAIGSFDDEVTAAAVRRARDEGIPVEGPFAADTLFIPERWRRYSLAVAQYHDQGLIPFKMLAFDRGVNVTLGLPIVRTSVDHGTAFDIAGRGVAGCGSMVEAIRVAASLVRLRRAEG
ncbi:MAG: 4-hydroxythreonine-4-phosphate dehydrogenase PdxA [Spirochaetes bacterium]|nr:4-hydroxythreonine-4-phosphate dehydrogenase PdxA [Spirochaetota bacterium]